MNANVAHGSTFAIGDRVRIRRGLDTVPGRVIDLYGDPVRAVVSLDQASESVDSDPGTTVTVPLGELVSADEPGDPAGHWLVAKRYERQIADALSRLTADLHADLENERADQGADFSIHQGDRMILVEVKAGQPVDRALALQRIQAAVGSDPGRIDILLVTPRAVSAVWSELAARIGANVVGWDSTRDDAALRRQLRSMLKAA